MGKHFLAKRLQYSCSFVSRYKRRECSLCPSCKQCRLTCTAALHEHLPWGTARAACAQGQHKATISLALQLVLARRGLAKACVRYGKRQCVCCISKHLTPWWPTTTGSTDCGTLSTASPGAMSTWSSLPQELALLMSRHMSTADMLQARAACRDWRSAFKQAPAALVPLTLDAELLDSFPGATGP